MALSTGTQLGASSGPDRSRRDLSAPWRHLDPVLLVCAIAIALIGVLMVYSATRNGVGPDKLLAGSPRNQSFLVKQGGFVTIGVFTMLVVASIDYRKYRDWIVPIYVIMCLMVALVVTPLGHNSKGTQARFEIAGLQLQPSEIAKVVLIVALASLLAAWKGDIDVRRLGLALAVAGLPMALIMLQPDLGTTLVFIAITVAMFVMAGVRGRYLAALTIVGVIGVAVILQSSVLQAYQRDRLTTFLDTSHATESAAYNVNQSQTTIANGGVWGKGLFKGPQTQLGYVPEQQTDFIFTVMAEELGFAGAATLLTLYAIVLWRTWRAAQLARDQLGTLICIGVLAMFVFQVFESVGMTMGIMPVTGIPLPFMSYGGSSTIACFMAIGLVLNVHMHRFR
jgi:rod shape determining protein RodA